MSHIKYVIRHNNFAYNDEWYQADVATLGNIHASYNDKAEADQAWRDLVVQALRSAELYNYGLFCGDAGAGQLEALDAFVLQACGEPLLADGYVEEFLPEALSDADVFEFAQRSGIMPFQLVEFDIAKPVYAIWFNGEQDYLRNYEDNSLLYGSHEDFIQDDDNEWLLTEQFDEPLKGTLSELSDSPQLLETLLHSAPGAAYDAEQRALVLEGYSVGYKNLKAINALLKQPIFEIRPLTFEQIQAH